MGRVMRSLPAALAALFALIVLSTCSNGVDFRAEVIDEVMKANDLYLEITDVTPNNQEENVSTFQTIRIVFDRDIDPGTISASTITILNESTQLPVNWTHGYNAATRLLSLNSALEGPIWYTVNVTEGVKGLDGSSLREPYAWTFETLLGLGGSLAINGGAVYTTSTAVIMNVTLNSIAEGYRVSTLADPTNYWEVTNPNSDWVDLGGPTSTTHPLPPALPSGDGEKTVYIQFRDVDDNRTPPLAVSDTITLDTTPPTQPAVTGTTPTTSRKPTWSWTSGGGGNGTYRYNIDAGGWSPD
ncbi:MAG TPA: Ig-like domain-containing protein, partial [Anaerolineales bacterium]|nr:Ig-like domain-containing protein [Anaerolineales bacterium]